MRRGITAGTAFTIAALGVFVALWFPVLTGQRVLLGGDALYQFLPWSNEPGAHAPSNIIVNDPLLQMLPWQQLVAREIGSGELPLWNPSAQSGVPLLANDAAAVFSPFTWFALLFPPAVGLSLAMLLKLVAAALGMALYLRTLKASGLASALAGVGFAASSFIVVWLAWPQSGVAAVMPWAFALAEIYLRGRKSWSLSVLALVVGLQFLGGNAETSLHLGLALVLYVAVRWAMTGHEWRVLGGFALAAALGTLLAGIQLAPFVDLLRHAALLSARSTNGMGFAHLGLSALTSWVFPNAVGNPGIDDHLGRLPNYNESTGFAGVALLVLSPLGAWWAWSRERSVAIALTGIGLVSAGIVYGPLTPLTGRLPGFGISNNERLLVVICFSVAALGGLGLDALLQTPRRLPFGASRGALWMGGAGLVVMAAAGLTLLFRGQMVDSLLPGYHSYIGFWLAAGLASLITAIAFVVGGLSGGDRRVAAGGLCVLALIEAAIFAGPFNPREPLDAVPPHSPSLIWLQAHTAGHPVAALGTALIPETAALYGLSDVRGDEILSDPRERLFWSRADPGYRDSTLITMFDSPGAEWLAAAGVGYVLMPSNRSLPGTTTGYSEGGVAIAEVPSPRSFAYAAASVVSATGPDQAVAVLAQAPLGPVVVEGCCPVGGSADVNVTNRAPTRIDLTVTAPSEVTVVVQQSFDPGWEATIDGRAATILPANVLFQAVTVPAGRHVLALRYRPPSVPIGEITSALAALALLLVAVMPPLWRRRTRAQ